MTESLAQCLESLGADADTVQQAARYYLAERTDDLEYEDMRAEVLSAASDPAKAEQLLQLLTVHSGHLEQGALLILSAAWEDPDEAELVRNALLDAKAKLPVIETAILGIVVMYGMYLITTRNRKTHKRTVHRTEKGFTESVETEYFPPSHPFSALVRLFNQPPP
ncbi:hypothetical protein [Streptomyces sp. NPDC046862]|uniref:hypothetical protein n=1 Tax=Streptomyces sp. NPDC046862 TaxID=3154603 RepID=UPI003452B9F1